MMDQVWFCARRRMWSARQLGPSRAATNGVREGVERARTAGGEGGGGRGRGGLTVVGGWEVQAEFCYRSRAIVHEFRVLTDREALLPGLCLGRVAGARRVQLRFGARRRGECAVRFGTSGHRCKAWNSFGGMEKVKR